MVYAVWLFGLGLFFLLLERAKPSRPNQRILRNGFWQDLGFLIFNSEYLGLLIGLVAIHLTRVFDPLVSWQVLAGQPLWVQLPILILVLDLMQWVVHNLMHRVPWLWEFHKLHHSAEEMDWLSNWRFHGVESVVYRSLLYVPAAFLGCSGEAMFWFGVLNTCVGHFAHANSDVSIGFLRFVFNHPQMHRWHHAHPDSGPPDRNFGILLSVWDWLFDTAYLPEGRTPHRYGFAGMERYPLNAAGRLIAPFYRRPA